MKNLKNAIPDKLDPRIMTVALIVGIVEFEVFTYARGVVKIAGRDAWICGLLGGLIVIGLTFLLVKLAARFPNENFFQYNRRLWGRLPAFLIGISYLAYWFLYLVIILEDSNEANKLFFLRETPSIVPLSIFGVIAGFSVLYGLTTLVRFFQVSFPFMMLPLAFIFTLSLAQIDTTSIGILGLECVKSSLYSGLDAMTVIELPGFPVQRFELFLTMPWLFGVITSVCLMVYLLSYGILELFHLKHKKFVCFAVSAFAVGAAYLFPSVAVERQVRSYLNIVTFIFIFVIPILTLLLAILRQKRGNADA